MRFGLALWPDRSLRELAQLASEAETAGFDDLWWPDHYDAREIASVLASCATATDRIRLGAAVTSPLLRHPVMLASLFATLGELSGGRALAGLGPGGFEVATHLNLRPKSPLTVTREAVEIIRGLTAGETVTMKPDSRFPIRGARLSFSTPTSIPIYLAGRGPKMVALAGEIADGVITHGLAPAYLAMVGEQVAAGLERTGRARGACEVVLMLEVSVDDDLERGRASLRRRCLYMVGGEYSEELIPLYGLDPARVIPIREAVRAGDPAAADAIDHEMTDAFALAGAPSLVAERLVSFEEFGVNSVILSPGKGVRADTIRTLGQAIKEAVR